MNKEIKLVLVGLVVLVLLFVGLTWLNHYNYQNSLILERDPKLTEDERKIYEDRLSQANVELAKTDLTNENKFDLLLHKGYQLHGLGKLQESIIYYSKAAELIPEKHHSYVAMYISQLDMKDIRGAQKSIRKALEINPTDSGLWIKYIVMERERFGARDEQVRNMYQDALEKTNGHVDIVTSYAVYLEGVGDFAGAKQQWEKAIEINPSNQAAYEAEIGRINQKLQAQ